MPRLLRPALAALALIAATACANTTSLFAYDTRRDAWRRVAQSPVAPQVTTLAVKVDGFIVIPSGEIRPGVRTPEVVRVRPGLSK